MSEKKQITPPLRRTNVRLPVQMHKALKELSVERGRSIESIVTGLIESFLHDKLPRNPTPTVIPFGRDNEGEKSRWRRLRKLVFMRREMRASQQRYQEELSSLFSALPGHLRPLGADVSLLTAYLQEIPASAVVKDLKGRIIWSNRDYEDLTGLPLRDLKLKTAMDLWPAQFARVIMQHDSLVANGKSMQVVEMLPSGAGDVRHRLALRFPIRGSLGRIVYTASIGFDLPDLPPVVGPLYRVDMTPIKSRRPSEK